MAIAALGYPGLTTDTSSSKGLASRPAGAGAKDRGVSLNLPAGATLYASFLLNIQTANIVTSRFFGLSPTSSGTSVNGNGAAIFLDTQRRLMIAKNSATPEATTTYALSTNNTYLVVLRYKYNPATSSDDSVDLWLDPTSLGNNASIPAPTLSTTANGDVAAFASVAYFQNNAVANAGVGSYYIDEIRVSTNWADVTPTNCSPGATFNVTGGGTVCAGAGFPIGLSGSESGVDYWLYTNGVYSSFVSGTGSAISFGTQTATATYTVLASNTVSGCVAWMNGNAAIALLAAPSIITQPIAITVASGGAGTITVTAAGDSLSYQWRKNGVNLSNGGHYGGVTTSFLTIYPADAGDVTTSLNGYDVVINGTCSPSVITSRVGLTLKTASDLVWTGDGISNLWDVATTTNWLQGGSLTNFNFGDNVIFDDSSINTVVALASSFLSPGLIKVTGAQNYAFRLGGNISGPGTALLMASTGTLFLTNGVNSFGGNVTISNGIIAFNNGLALGTGAIKLAGGTLDSLNALVTLANPVNVTADSTIRVNNTTSSALTMTNTLTGTAGTLTLRNNVGFKPSILLTGSGFDFARPVTLDIGSGTGLIVSGNNTAGTQTFSGVISGPGTIQRNASGGTTVLTSSNLYSGGTSLLNGTLGVGADSVSSFPPTVDYGPLGTGTLTIDTGAGTPRITAVGGAHSVDNLINFSSANIGSPLIVTGSNNLTFNGDFDLSTGNRTIQTDNTGKTIFNGSLNNGGLTKTGTGVLYLNGNNGYTDPTIVSAGTLGGNGTLNGPVTINSSATLAPGNSVGTLTINSDLTINGNLAIELNKSLSPSNDLVVVSGVLTNSGTGTVTVANLGPALVVGDTFTLFSQAVSNGAALTVTGASVTWTNKLAIDGSIRVLSLAPPIANYPTNISYTVSGGTLTVSWPATHLGWNLQSQTNALNKGLGTNWVTIPGTSAVTFTNLTIIPANPTVFYRLSKP